MYVCVCVCKRVYICVCVCITEYMFLCVCVSEDDDGDVDEMNRRGRGD